MIKKDTNNRYFYNNLILEQLKSYFEQNKDIRFNQALYNLNIINNNFELYNTESKTTYENMQNKQNNLIIDIINQKLNNIQDSRSDFKLFINKIISYLNQIIPTYDIINILTYYKINLNNKDDVYTDIINLLFNQYLHKKYKELYKEISDYSKIINNKNYAKKINGFNSYGLIQFKINKKVYPARHGSDEDYTEYFLTSSLYTDFFLDNELVKIKNMSLNELINHNYMDDLNTYKVKILKYNKIIDSIIPKIKQETKELFKMIND